ncbi:MAG TPA: serine/threonine-protein kinase [Polyangiaceae bacterium]|nr:serine/threonine-protein kinase [Polyangiaceae bacterium]
MDHGHHAAGVAPGQILAGKYRIERVLGMGGMGVVVAATHIHLEDRVAIKFLLPHALDNTEAVARFLREARAAVRIKSEHVARVSDVGTLENDAPYMVMEYLEGSDLSQLLKEHGTLPTEEAIEYVLQACEAIAEAHSLGIVHRDLKPANLYLIRRPDGTPSVKVLDFGISKWTGREGSSAELGLTRTSAMMGSPLYMSPEQMASSKDADNRSDIWSLGAILHELLSGHVPFDAESMPELCGMLATKDPPRLSSLRPDAPAKLDAVILRCLEKDRAKRFTTIAELAEALAPFGTRRARRSIERISGVLRAPRVVELRTDDEPPSEMPNALAASGAGMDTSWGKTETKPAGKNRRNVAFAAVGLLALAVLGVVVTHQERTAEGPPSDASALPAAAPPTAVVQLAVSGVAESASAAPALAPVANSVPSVSAAVAPITSATTPKLVAHAARAVPSPTKALVAPAPSAAASATKKPDLYNDRK